MVFWSSLGWLPAEPGLLDHIRAVLFLAVIFVFVLLTPTTYIVISVAVLFLVSWFIMSFWIVKDMDMKKECMCRM
jgi:hypothetical protein